MRSVTVTSGGAARRFWSLVVAVACAGSALAGCGGHHSGGAADRTEPPAHQRLSGALQLVDHGAGYSFGTPCSGRGTAADVRAGTPVVVRDASNAVIAQGRLQAGNGESTSECVFPFVVDGLPLEPSYRVDIGRYGAVAFTQNALNAARWNIQLGLDTGGPDADRLTAQ